jgi:hypothetical protein
MNNRARRLLERSGEWLPSAGAMQRTLDSVRCRHGVVPGEECVDCSGRALAQLVLEEFLVRMGAPRDAARKKALETAWGRLDAAGGQA